MDIQALGQQVRLLRRQRGISQQIMAGHLAISRSTLNGFETGRVNEIGIQKVIKMLDYLGFELSLREKSTLPTFEDLLNEQ